MRVIISGATGLIGSALVRALLAEGHHVTRLTRGASSAPVAGTSDVRWNPESGEIDAARLEGHDAVVHLAGENIGEGRWTAAKKARIRESRVAGTNLLARASAGLRARPSLFVSASAIGYYGDRGTEILHEESSPGDDFLAQVCRDWEAAAEPARSAGITVLHPRFGVVLSQEGGALAKLLTPFKMGVGGKVGTGDQYMSWVALDDVTGALRFMLSREGLSGPVNVVAPRPVTNSEFTKTLGRVLERPTLLPVPAFGVRLAFGEMGDALLLSSARVEPARLREAGYDFLYPELESALSHLLRQSR